MAVSKPTNHLFSPDKTAVVVFTELLFCRQKAIPFSFRGHSQQRHTRFKASLPKTWPSLPETPKASLATTLQPHLLLTHIRSPPLSPARRTSRLLFKHPGKMLQPRAVWVAVEFCTAFVSKKNPKLGILCFDKKAGSVPLTVSVSINTSWVNSKSPGKYPDFISSFSPIRKLTPEQTKSKAILNLPNPEKTQHKKVFFFLKTMLPSGLVRYLMLSFLLFWKGVHI